MTKTEMVEQYGNDLVAYDATEYQNPILLCYWDDEKVLAYDVKEDKYSLVKMQYYADGGVYFIIDSVRYKGENFVRTDSLWASNIPKTIKEWKKDNLDVRWNVTR